MTASQVNMNDNAVDILGGNGIPMIRKSKLLVVDLAGSERINKSGLLFFVATTQPLLFSVSLNVFLSLRKLPFYTVSPINN